MGNGLMEDDANQLSDLLLAWEEAWEQGTDLSPAELCTGAPELIPQLEQQIARLKKMAWMSSAADTVDVTEPDLLIGQTLANRYVIESFVAAGGFGRVYRAFDNELQRHVALKLARMDRSRSTDSLLHEARRTAKLRHPGIVSVHDVVKHDGSVVIVSDLIEGRSLAAVIAEGQTTIKQATRWIVEVAEALQAAHEQGFIHRDIKPSNILIDQKGRASITDFGIATTVDQVNNGDALSSGTLAYMAPEQILAEIRLLGPGTDLWALGVVFYQLLTTKHPHKADSDIALRENALLRLPVPPRQFNSEIPIHIEQVCLRCLAKHPADRFETATAVIEAINSPGLLVSAPRLSQLLLAIIAVAVLLTASFVAGQWTDSAPQPAPVVAIESQDRKVAEKIIAMGGELEITGKDGNQRLYFPADIPATEFVITEIKVLAVREFGDEHLPMFVGLPRLRTIYNAHTATTDEGMKSVGEIATLHGIGCGGNKITAEGIGHLTKLKFIRLLDVNDSPLITNDVFKHLYNMPSLREINLTATAVTLDAVNEFRAKRPDCRLQFEQ